GGDRLELADPLAQIGDLDPASGGGQAAFSGHLRQLHLLELEPAVPGPQARDARSAQPHDHARRQHSDRQRIHHFSSCRSASISRASSSFWLLMWWSIAISRRSVWSRSLTIAWVVGRRCAASPIRSKSLIRLRPTTDLFFCTAR